MVDVLNAGIQAAGNLQELARVLGVSRSTLAHWNNGEWPALEMFLRLCDYVGQGLPVEIVRRDSEELLQARGRVSDLEAKLAERTEFYENTIKALVNNETKTKKENLVYTGETPAGDPDADQIDPRSEKTAEQKDRRKRGAG